LNGKSVDIAWKKTYYKPFLHTFHANFNNLFLKMIPWPKLEGSQPYGTLRQALILVSAVTTEDSNSLLLLKQVEGLNPG